MTDLQLIEIGEGGDLVLLGNDLAKVYGYETAVYLALFGGDAWVFNYLVPKRPFASKTQAALLSNPLTSAGRLAIEKAVNEDLEFLKNIPGVSYTVSVVIASKDTIQIDINFNGELFSYKISPNDAMPKKVCAIVTGLTAGTITIDSIEFSWDSAAIPGYEWFITTVNVEPTGTGTFSATSTVNVTGLSPATTYYFWVRSICTGGIVSGFVSTTADTTSNVPVSPVTSGLVGFYVSSYGVTLDGSGGIDTWADQSGNSNDLVYGTGTKGVLSPASFGSEAGIYINGSKYATASNFVGIASPTTDKVTAYLVVSFLPNSVSQGIIDYSATGFINGTDGFAAFLEKVGLTTQLNAKLKGDVGLTLTQVPTVGNAGVIYRIEYDKSAPSASTEVRILAYFSGGTNVPSPASTGANNTNNFGDHPLHFGYQPATGFTANATVGALMVFNRVLSAPEQALMETYLRNKYSII